TEVNQKGAFEPYYDMPNFLGVRDVDGGFTWVEYETGERELYDLKSDPQQLTNRADDPAYAPVRQRLEARLTELAKSIQLRCGGELSAVVFQLRASGFRASKPNPKWAEEAGWLSADS